VHTAVHELVAESRPSWHSTIVSVEMPGVARAGEELLAEVVARNTGTLAWTALSGGRSACLQLGCHFLDNNGQVVLWDGPRTPVMRFIPPGETLLFLVNFAAPAAGDYLVEWDLVSEAECWFADCGGIVLRNKLKVIA
jgi:hypothetical protein